MALPISKLTKRQKREWKKSFMEDGEKNYIIVTARYDDKCGNGHNSFAITGETYHRQAGRKIEDCCGCIHEEIEKHFPELRKYIKWHLTSSDGPWGYLENTRWHSNNKDCHGLRKGEFNSFTYNVVVEGKTVFQSKVFYSFRNWIHRDEAQLQADGFLKFIKPSLNAEIQRIGHGAPSEGKPIEIEQARSCAVWPDATLEQLQSKEQLEARLPGLMVEFKEAMEELDFIY